MNRERELLGEAYDLLIHAGFVGPGYGYTLMKNIRAELDKPSIDYGWLDVRPDVLSGLRPVNIDCCQHTSYPVRREER
jgi:hypothetical protein